MNRSNNSTADKQHWQRILTIYLFRLRTESLFEKYSGFLLWFGTQQLTWLGLLVSTSNSEYLRQHFPKAWVQVVENFWSDDSRQFTELTNRYPQSGTASNLHDSFQTSLLAYCKLQVRVDSDSLDLPSQIIVVSTNFVRNWFFYKGANQHQRPRPSQTCSTGWTWPNFDTLNIIHWSRSHSSLTKGLEYKATKIMCT